MQYVQNIAANDVQNYKLFLTVVLHISPTTQLRIWFAILHQVTPG